MRYDEMVKAVAERNRTGDAEADQILTAALATLAEHLTPDEARQVRSQLPDELQETMATGGAERFDASELVRRFMVRSGVGRDRAGLEAEAAMAVVRSALSAGEWEDLVAQLPFDPSADLSGVVPADTGEAELAATAGNRQGVGWRREAGGWVATTADRSRRATVVAEGGAFVARVERFGDGREAGEAGDAVRHGPAAFDRAEDALLYAEMQMGTTPPAARPGAAADPTTIMPGHSTAGGGPAGDGAGEAGGDGAGEAGGDAAGDGADDAGGPEADAAFDTTITKIDARFAPVGPEGERYLAMGVSMGMRLWLYEPAGDKPETSRDYETLGYCLSGRAELHSEGGQIVVLEQGDSWVVPRMARHHYRIIEPFSAVETTHPPAVVAGRDR